MLFVDVTKIEMKTDNPECDTNLEEWIWFLSNSNTEIIIVSSFFLNGWWSNNQHVPCYAYKTKMFTQNWT